MDQPQEVKLIAHRISELRYASKQVSMDGSAYKMQLEKLYEHADLLYSEFSNLMRAMGWKR